MFLFVVFFRTIILYILVIFALRIMGKRQIGELQPSELVITILISNIASLPIEDVNVPLASGAIPILLLASFEVIVSTISLHNTKFRKFVSGSPILIIKNGVVDQKMLHEIRFSVDDLTAELRSQGIFDINEVLFAFVETTGKLSVYKKIEEQPLTPSVMQISQEETGPQCVVVSDGIVLKKGLYACDKTSNWLLNKIKGENLSLQDVLLMTCDSKGTYNIIKKQKNGGI